MRRRPAWERFWEKVDLQGSCWVWTAATNGKGYGVFELNRELKTVQAHRYAWRILVGDPDPNLTLDHLCRNTLCVNPDHMEEVLRGDNSLRGNTIVAKNLAKTHCKHGHEFTPKNTRVRNRPGRRPSRECWTCHNAK